MQIDSQPQQVNDEIDSSKLMNHLKEDRIKVLFPKLTRRIHAHEPTIHDEIAMYVMNLDHEQVIAALNNDELFKSLVDVVLQLYNRMLDNLNHHTHPQS